MPREQANADNDTAAAPGRLSTMLAGLIVLLIFLAPAAGFWWLWETSRSASENSVLWHTRDMLFRHFARTGGHWPASWEDLAADFEPADAGYSTPSFEAMQQRVAIDFDFDPATLDEPANRARAPRVFWLKDHPDNDAVDAANARLLEVLQSRRDPPHGDVDHSAMPRG